MEMLDEPDVGSCCSWWWPRWPAAWSSPGTVHSVGPSWHMSCYSQWVYLLADSSFVFKVWKCFRLTQPFVLHSWASFWNAMPVAGWQLPPHGKGRWEVSGFWLSFSLRENSDHDGWPKALAISWCCSSIEEHREFWRNKFYLAAPYNCSSHLGSA